QVKKRGFSAPTTRQSVTSIASGANRRTRSTNRSRRSGRARRASDDAPTPDSPRTDTPGPSLGRSGAVGGEQPPTAPGLGLRLDQRAYPADVSGPFTQPHRSPFL